VCAALQPAALLRRPQQAAAGRVRKEIEPRCAAAVAQPVRSPAAAAAAAAADAQQLRPLL
jgi:hypothetical protein